MVIAQADGSPHTARYQSHQKLSLHVGTPLGLTVD